MIDPCGHFGSIDAELVWSLELFFEAGHLQRGREWIVGYSYIGDKGGSWK
jgi:hypothetical protein